jgi:putative ABC transport system substrate-binding protein
MWSRTIGCLITLALFLTPLTAAAQPAGPVRRIGWLRQGDPGNPAIRDAFQQGLRDMGYIEGQHYVLEYRSGKGHFEPLPALAAELVGLPVDVLATTGIAATRAAKEATSRIPIVFIGANEPIAHGLITSYARPGGYITGIVWEPMEFQVGKVLELLKEVIPTMTHVAVLVNPDNPGFPIGAKALQAATQTLRVHLHLMEVRDPATELDRAFAALAPQGVDALYIAGDASFLPYRTQIVERVATTQLPAIYAYGSYVEAGGLLSYAADPLAITRRAGVMVGKILGGTKPADIPVEFPMKFVLTINLKTAKVLGLTMPPSLLLLADEVIQ